MVSDLYVTGEVTKEVVNVSKEKWKPFQWLFKQAKILSILDNLSIHQPGKY